MNTWLRSVRTAPMLSPTGLLARAAVLVLVYLVLEAFGLRSYASVLTSTAPPTTASQGLAAGLFLLYAMAYFGFVLLVPVLVLGAGIQAVFLRFETPKPH